eukprot:gene8393-10309_t
MTNLSKTIGALNKFIENLIKLFAQTSGKDKLAKILQYGAKLAGHVLLTKSGPKSEWLQIVKKLETTSGSARKVWRLGNTLAEQQKIMTMLRAKNAFAFLNILALIRQFGMYFYWVFDHLILSTNIGFTKLNTVKLGWYSSVSWFFGLLCSIIIDLNSLSVTLKKEKSLQLSLKNNQDSIIINNPDNSSNNQNNLDTLVDMKSIRDQLVEITKKKNEVYLNCIKNLADLFIASALLKFYNFSQGTIGLCGLISAFIGGYQMFPK